MRRPRGTAAGAAPGWPMYIVRGCAAAAAADGAGAPMRVPQAPQNAKPGVTERPHEGQVTPSGAAAGPDMWPLACEATAPTGDNTGGDGVGLDARLGSTPAAVMLPTLLDEDGPDIAGDGVTTTATDGGSGLLLGGGVSGIGILGESFQGMPPFGLAGCGVVDETSSPGSGGRTVRAVSMGSGSRVGRGSGFAAAPFSSLPQPRQNL
jgi:hypothetical protein